MDGRVTRLIDDLKNRRVGAQPDGTVDYEAWSDAIFDLHAQVEDEESRVELLALYHALMSTGADALHGEGRDTAEFEGLWRSNHLRLLLREAIGADGEVDVERLAVIQQREAAAGRLGQDESLHFERVPAAPPHSPELEAVLEEVREAIPAWRDESLDSARFDLLFAYRERVEALRAAGSLDWETGRAEAAAVAEEWRSREDGLFKALFLQTTTYLAEAVERENAPAESLRFVWDEIETCRDQLFNGMRLALDAALAEEPEPEPAPQPAPAGAQPSRLRSGAIHPEDYPASALRKGEEGVVTVDIEVGTNGRVTECSVHQSSGSEELDRATCRLITSRFRFEPATDEGGHPVAQVRRQSVRWQIPENEKGHAMEAPEEEPKRGWRRLAEAAAGLVRRPR